MLKKTTWLFGVVTFYMLASSLTWGASAMNNAQFNKFFSEFQAALKSGNQAFLERLYPKNSRELELQAKGALTSLFVPRIRYLSDHALKSNQARKIEVAKIEMRDEDTAIVEVKNEIQNYELKFHRQYDRWMLYTEMQASALIEAIQFNRYIYVIEYMISPEVGSMPFELLFKTDGWFNVGKERTRSVHVRQKQGSSTSFSGRFLVLFPGAKGVVEIAASKQKQDYSLAFKLIRIDLNNQGEATVIYSSKNLCKTFECEENDFLEHHILTIRNQAVNFSYDVK